MLTYKVSPLDNFLSSSSEARDENLNGGKQNEHTGEMKELTKNKVQLKSRILARYTGTANIETF